MQLYKPYQTLLELLTFHHIPDEPKEIWKVKFETKSHLLLIFSYKKDFDQKYYLQIRRSLLHERETCVSNCLKESALFALKDGSHGMSVRPKIIRLSENLSECPSLFDWSKWTAPGKKHVLYEAQAFPLSTNT